MFKLQIRRILSHLIQNAKLLSLHWNLQDNVSEAFADGEHGKALALLEKEMIFSRKS